MYNITLISTFHSEFGKCNSDELYKIIESINPQVIFGEPSNKSFDIIYNSNSLNLPLDIVTEIKCVKKYVQNHNIKHIPVDIDTNPELFTEMETMFGEFYKHDDVYKKLVDEGKLLTAQYGFDYLNSKKYLDLDEKMKLRAKQLIESNCFYKNELLRIYELSNKEIDNRENAMLQNIYNYSKENQYHQAVFLLGCGHRKSIIQTITEYEKLSEIKLNWMMYGNKQKICL